MNRIILAAVLCVAVGSAWAADIRIEEIALDWTDFEGGPTHDWRIGLLPAAESDWHLLTTSYGGTVSLLKGLTKEECDRVVVLLKDAIGAAIRAPQLATPGDIKSAECFQ